MNRLQNFLRSEEATTTVEYTVMLSLIVLVAISAISGIGVAVANAYASLDSGVSAVI